MAALHALRTLTHALAVVNYSLHTSQQHEKWSVTCNDKPHPAQAPDNTFLLCGSNVPFLFFFFPPHSHSPLCPSVRLTLRFPHLFESISEWMEEPAVSVAWFRAVWQKVTSSCSVRGGWDEEGGERRGGMGWDGNEGGRGKERKGKERGKIE